MTVSSNSDTAAAAEDLPARATAARLVLAANAAETEEMGRPTAESLAAARDAGAFALTTPRRFGGLDADNRTMLQVLAELGAGCTSTAWLAQVSATVKTQFAGWMTPHIQEAIYADPDVRLCGSALPTGTARKVSGGLRISGRWSYASGCLDAQWAMVGITASNDEVRPFPVVLPTSEFTIDRTWDGVRGLQGTGSHTLVADDVFVASGFQTDPPGDAGMLPPDVRLLLQVALHTASPLLGAAWGALGAVEPVMTAERPILLTAYQRRAESPLARQLFAEAHNLVTTAETRLLNVADLMDAAFAEDVSLSAVRAAQQRWQIAAAVQECRSAVEKLLDLHGSSAFAPSNPLGRFWQDLSVGSRHVILNPFASAEGYGQALVDDGLGR